jgi:hypothetical protein
MNDKQIREAFERIEKEIFESDVKWSGDFEFCEIKNPISGEMTDTTDRWDGFKLGFKLAQLRKEKEAV